jgi:hypothetical protein
VCDYLASKLKTLASFFPNCQLEDSEVDYDAFLQILFNTIELNAGVKDHVWNSIEPEVSTAGWANVYNTWFHAFLLENDHLPPDFLKIE